MAVEKGSGGLGAIYLGDTLIAGGGGGGGPTIPTAILTYACCFGSGTLPNMQTFNSYCVWPFIYRDSCCDYLFVQGLIHCDGCRWVSTTLTPTSTTGCGSTVCSKSYQYIYNEDTFGVFQCYCYRTSYGGSWICTCFMFNKNTGKFEQCNNFSNPVLCSITFPTRRCSYYQTCYSCDIPNTCNKVYLKWCNTNSERGICYNI